MRGSRLSLEIKDGHWFFSVVFMPGFKIKLLRDRGDP